MANIIEPRLEVIRGCIDRDQRKILVACLGGSLQSQDLTLPPNCQGYGRLRHFKRFIAPGWPNDPLPIDPASKALGLPVEDMIVAQVFQVACCDWRCWYCFVPENLLSRDNKASKWLSPSEIMDLYLQEENKAPVIDLSGGSPNLVPEWIPWMMKEIKLRGLQDEIYLWSDDNLSNDLFWTCLTEEEIELVCNYKMYGRVCCFKGYDDISFSFNSGAKEQLFTNQFDIMKRYLSTGMELYAYATFTTPTIHNIEHKMRTFIDKLQTLHENLPLRTIPLLIQAFTPVRPRLTPIREEALKNQWVAIDLWMEELEKRFGCRIRETNIADIPI